MELSAFLSCQPFLFPIPQQQQEGRGKNDADKDHDEDEGGSNSNFDQKWIHRTRATLELNSVKKKIDNNANEKNNGTTTTNEGKNHDGGRTVNVNKKKNLEMDAGSGDDDHDVGDRVNHADGKDHEEPNEVLLHLVDHVVSIEPVVSYKLTKEENDGGGGDDEEDEEEEDTSEQNEKEGLAGRPSLGPAFFIPLKSNIRNNTTSSSSSASNVDDDSNNNKNHNEGFDYGMYPIELALVTSKNIKDMHTQTKVLNSSTSTKKSNHQQHRQGTKPATVLPSATNFPVINDVDTVLLAKIGQSEDCQVYQINLSLLRKVERVQTDNDDDDDDDGCQKDTDEVEGGNDDKKRKNNPKKMGKDGQERPSCLLLHFPGCTFRIFDPSTPSGTESSVSPSKSPPTNLHSKSSSSSSTDVGGDRHSHQYLHSSDGTTPNSSTEGTSRLDEAQIVVHDTLNKIITSSEGFSLPFPLNGHISNDNDNSKTSDFGRSRLEESMSRRRCHHTAFVEVFELESILSSLANEMVESSSSSSSSSSSIIDDELKQRLRHLMRSIPSNVFTSISSLDESLIETMGIYDEAIDENGLKLSDLLKKFFGSDSDTKSSNKRRRFGHSSSLKSKPKSPASSSLSPAKALHDQKDHARTTCQLLAQNKKLLSHKYELLSLAER